MHFELQIHRHSVMVKGLLHRELPTMSVPERMRPELRFHLGRQNKTVGLDSAVQEILHIRYMQNSLPGSRRI
uniref:Uncharacterized protein n=1 Tax=viral metagenome TaxID=1070528 RepID=A0A6C0K0N2_9ZZZZ